MWTDPISTSLDILYLLHCINKLNSSSIFSGQCSMFHRRATPITLPGIKYLASYWTLMIVNKHPSFITIWPFLQHEIHPVKEQRNHSSQTPDPHHIPGQHLLKPFDGRDPVSRDPDRWLFKSLLWIGGLWEHPFG